MLNRASFQDFQPAARYFYIPTSILFTILFCCVSVFDVRVTTAVSHSMQPTIEEGDLIITRRVEYHDLKMGNVASILNENSLQRQFSRIVDIRYGEDSTLLIRTKEDANNLANSEYEYTEQQTVQRVVFVVPKLGQLTDNFSSVNRLLMLVFACAVAVVSLLRFKKRRTQANI